MLIKSRAGISADGFVSTPEGQLRWRPSGGDVYLDRPPELVCTPA